jgi:3-hydroxy acid dehydrogenase/malonic semialdehyde reductase
MTTVFITGASTGFDAAITRRFAADGAGVIAAARRGVRLTELTEQLGPTVLALQLDVHDRAAVEQAIDDLPASFADVDVLVNNAGLAKGVEPAHQARLEDWQQVIDTNCNGLV